jgi:hypothetical protein
MGKVRNFTLGIVILSALTGCGTVTNQATGASSTNASSPNTVAANVTSTQPSSRFHRLDSGAQKVIVMKNTSKTTITNQATVKTLVKAFNQAAEGKKSTIHCNAMTQDEYRITFVYGNGQTRVFTNVGGACRPMIDQNSGFKFPSSNLLSKLRN